MGVLNCTQTWFGIRQWGQKMYHVYYISKRDYIEKVITLSLEPKMMSGRECERNRQLENQRISYKMRNAPPYVG